MNDSEVEIRERLGINDKAGNLPFTEVEQNVNESNIINRDDEENENIETRESREIFHRKNNESLYKSDKDQMEFLKIKAEEYSKLQQEYDFNIDSVPEVESTTIDECRGDEAVENDNSSEKLTSHHQSRDTEGETHEVENADTEREQIAKNSEPGTTYGKVKIVIVDEEEDTEKSFECEAEAEEDFKDIFGEKDQVTLLSNLDVLHTFTDQLFSDGENDISVIYDDSTLYDEGTSIASSITENRMKMLHNLTSKIFPQKTDKTVSKNSVIINTNVEEEVEVSAEAIEEKRNAILAIAKQLFSTKNEKKLKEICETVSPEEKNGEDVIAESKIQVLHDFTSKIFSLRLDTEDEASVKATRKNKNVEINIVQDLTEKIFPQGGGEEEVQQGTKVDNFDERKKIFDEKVSRLYDLTTKFFSSRADDEKEENSSKESKREQDDVGNKTDSSLGNKEAPEIASSIPPKTESSETQSQSEDIVVEMQGKNLVIEKTILHEKDETSPILTNNEIEVDETYNEDIKNKEKDEIVEEPRELIAEKQKEIAEEIKGKALLLSVNSSSSSEGILVEENEVKEEKVNEEREVEEKHAELDLNEDESDSENGLGKAKKKRVAFDLGIKVKENSKDQSDFAYIYNAIPNFITNEMKCLSKDDDENDNYGDIQAQAEFQKWLFDHMYPSRSTFITKDMNNLSEENEEDTKNSGSVREEFQKWLRGYYTEMLNRKKKEVTESKGKAKNENRSRSNIENEEDEAAKKPEDRKRAARRKKASSKSKSSKKKNKRSSKGRDDGFCGENEIIKVNIHELSKVLLAQHKDLTFQEIVYNAVKDLSYTATQVKKDIQDAYEESYEGWLKFLDNIEEETLTLEDENIERKLSEILDEFKDPEWVSDLPEPIYENFEVDTPLALHVQKSTKDASITLPAAMDKMRNCAPVLMSNPSAADEDVESSEDYIQQLKDKYADENSEFTSDNIKRTLCRLSDRMCNSNCEAGFFGEEDSEEEEEEEENDCEKNADGVLGIKQTASCVTTEDNFTKMKGKLLEDYEAEEVVASFDEMNNAFLRMYPSQDEAFYMLKEKLIKAEEFEQQKGGGEKDNSERDNVENQEEEVDDVLMRVKKRVYNSTSKGKKIDSKISDLTGEIQGQIAVISGENGSEKSL